MRLLLLCAVAGVLMLPTTNASAQKTVIYRCTDASGALTVQNAVPCPKGSQQDRRVIDAVATVPAPPAAVRAPRATLRPVPAAASPSAANSATTPASADSTRLPPPALFECRTFDSGRYLSDDGNPPQRCAPLTTNGIGGGSAPGAGASCEMVSDQCQRIADGALCEHWSARLLQAQSALRFGQPGNRDTAQAEVDRVLRIVEQSTCGIP